MKNLLFIILVSSILALKEIEEEPKLVLIHDLKLSHNITYKGDKESLYLIFDVGQEGFDNEPLKYCSFYLNMGEDFSPSEKIEFALFDYTLINETNDSEAYNYTWKEINSFYESMKIKDASKYQLSYEKSSNKDKTFTYKVKFYCYEKDQYIAKIPINATTEEREYISYVGETENRFWTYLFYFILVVVAALIVIITIIIIISCCCCTCCCCYECCHCSGKRRKVIRLNENVI